MCLNASTWVAGKPMNRSTAKAGAGGGGGVQRLILFTGAGGARGAERHTDCTTRDGVKSHHTDCLKGKGNEAMDWATENEVIKSTKLTHY